MSRLHTAAKILVVAILLTAISVFTRATPLTLIALVLGGVLVVLGSLYSYKPGAMMGVIIVAMGAASSIQLDSLLEISTVLTAILGLLVPLFLLALYTLGTALGDLRFLSARGRSAFSALLFCFACVLSVPVVIGLMSVVTPTIATQLSVTAETATMLLATAAGGIYMTRRTHTKTTIGQIAEPTEDEPA